MAANDSNDVDTMSVEAPDIESVDVPKHGFLTRLYTGTGAFNIIGKRRVWYAVSGLILTIGIVSMIVRGFTFGIDFVGGTQISLPAAGGHGTTTTQQVEGVFSSTLGKAPQSVQTVGTGDAATVQIRSVTLTNDEVDKLRTALFDKFQPKGKDGQPSKLAISDSGVSETWGQQITQKGVVALVVFVVLAAIYVAVRYEPYMAVAALAAMFFTVFSTAGIYSLVGWEVTPATVIGLLTILGYSIYDTVVVFDKVEENTHGFEHTTRRTYAEQANLAVNQTFMRSINTGLIAMLPIIALMVVAVWMLGVGTLKDLALVQLIGIFTGHYASIFFATPLLVSLRERTDLVKNHTRRVLNRRKSANERGTGTAVEEVSVGALTAPEKPEPGAKPLRPGRPSGKRNHRG
ncbi:protein translocase subunit SecF [Mycobacterium sp. CBMA293]|uniref:protein translocase subunit SecF n=1 Tax=unclassified Mycolicibacterium TaxID=2636767 RepID=UPI0012DF3F99|nr:MULTISPECIES: protein translocase subunit SecF [unclassified Mycolicibacterium]MUL58136.1 protein translocase subunit SecF [Mycolicibacterium sp. CBMA 335]MUL73594.1 protein translocase subunit SecF [Mycolicibacterium sp. CBMA 311]MUL93019.1 protein translocase subunit SecF [Mycolicibacterium sp. CBMA 230]MUM07568.1 protein translocase subunit SecF [Mycolicibacterium sp. CBMA 213]MUM09862.1 protein translocase subunit SecF [Mycolicibacterium sp. CBMA 293]